MPDSDEDSLLIQKIGQGDEHALVSLMERYKEPVFHFVYRYLRNEADCAEVTEKIFFRIFQKADTFSPRATVKTWIFTIALNSCRDRLRRQKKLHGQVSLDASVCEGKSEGQLLGSIASGSADPYSELRTSDTLQVVNGQIQKLPERLKFPFVFCVLEGHSYDECAAVLKSNRKTVETRIYRARKLLRSALDGIV